MWSAFARHPLRKLAPQPAAQRQPDEERVAEQIDEERLHRVERIGTAQVEEENASAWRACGRPERNHAAVL